ncbi:hypothetical protein [Sphingosinicella microcystinivorans]|uniref:hypothetical protein n=1 Tax=Sphingosinicella microcystinivorans TaxID=335406 RepID=UPI00135CD192
MPDPLYGEIGHAWVLPDAAAGEATPDAEALESYCRDHLTNYKVPKRFHVRPKGPTLMTGPKIIEWVDVSYIHNLIATFGEVGIARYRGPNFLHNTGEVAPLHSYRDRVRRRTARYDCPSVARSR